MFKDSKRHHHRHHYHRYYIIHLFVSHTDEGRIAGWSVCKATSQSHRDIAKAGRQADRPLHRARANENGRQRRHTHPCSGPGYYSTPGRVSNDIIHTYVMVYIICIQCIYCIQQSSCACVDDGRRRPTGTTRPSEYTREYATEYASTQWNMRVRNEIRPSSRSCPCG
jgi:hypothetical protein